MTFYFDEKRRLYLYKAQAILVPNATQVGEYAVVRETLENMQALVRAGYPVRDPLINYDFPGPYRKIEAQHLTASHVVLNPRSFVLSDMRTGKTVSVLWATDFVLRDYAKRGEQASVLILCTKSTMFDPWEKHIREMFGGARTCQVITGSAQNRYAQFRKPADYYVANYDGLKLIAAAELPEYVKFVVVDEFTAYKHSTTRRYRQAYACFGPLRYLTLMSGTPASDKSVDAYGPAKMVHGMNGESYDSFRNRCMYRTGQFRWVERKEAKDIVASVLRPSIRFTREQVVGLPNKLPVRTIAAELSDAQHTIVDGLRNKAKIDIGSKVITPVHAAAYRLKFMQAYQGVIYDDEKNSHDLHPHGRLAALKEILDESMRGVLVFSGFSGVIEMLRRELAGYHPMVITGAVSAKQRLNIMTAFNTGKCKLIVGDPGTMAHGLDLTGGDTVVWYGPIDRNEHYQQANERIEGLRQKYPTQIVHLQSSKLERELYKRLQEKQELQMSILELLE